MLAAESISAGYAYIGMLWQVNADIIMQVHTEVSQ